MKLRIQLTIMALALTAMAHATNKCSRLYMYGLVTSFNDSTVYFTDIQVVDSAWVDKKTGFLYSRDNYSYQLRQYMKEHGVEHPTCVTSYAPKRKDVEKKYAAIKKKYTKKGGYTLKYITLSDFTFEPIKPDESEMASTASAKKEEKQKRKEEKQKQKQQRPPMGEKGNRPPMPNGERPQQPPMM